MVLTNSVIRRYTPPTCTLQVVARNSPLPRLKGQAEKKLLQFELRFDDPRLSEKQQIHIQGDRQQLEALQEAVTVYTQNLLNQSPERFNAILSALAPPLPNESTFTPQVPDAETDDFQTVSEESRSLSFSDTSAHLASSIAYEDSTTGLFGKIFLQPGRGLSHKLFLGAMATEETGPSIQLSILQLFDLSTALDEYSADALTIPVLSPSRSAATTSVWASIATVLLVAVGLTAVVLILNRSNPRQQIAQESNPQGSSSKPQPPVALQPLPTTPLPVPTTLPSTTVLPPLPPPLSSIPSPSAIPFGAVPGTLPPNTTPGANTRAIRPAPPTFNITPSQSVDSLLREAKGSRTSGPTLNVPVPPTAATLPSPSPDSKTSPSAPSSTSETQTGSNPTVQQSPNFASTPNPLGIPTPLAPGSTANPLGIPTPSGTSGLGLTQTMPSSGSPNSPSESKTSALFDITPQITEVREYFKQRWSPPSGLNQALQYSILLDVDGSIQRIIPLGQASINYVDRSSMPGVGKRFVSANKSGQTSRIRVVLFPNGRVQAFPELSNQ